MNIYKLLKLLEVLFKVNFIIGFKGLIKGVRPVLQAFWFISSLQYKFDLITCG